MPQKGRFESKKPHFYSGRALFWGTGKWEFFPVRNHLFPILGILTPVGGGRIRKSKFVENSPSYRPKTRKYLIWHKRDRKRLFPFFCKETQKWLKSAFLAPTRPVSSHFGGQNVTFESLFGHFWVSLRKRGKVSFTVEFKIIPYQVLLFLNYLPYFFSRTGPVGNIYRNSRESTENEGWHSALRGTAQNYRIGPGPNYLPYKIPGQGLFRII